MSTEQPKYYRFSFGGVKLDPYRIMQVYGITNPAQQHALKKLLRAGNSVKPLIQDIDEVILSLNRWKEMLNEEVQNETKEVAPSLTEAERKTHDHLVKQLQRTDLTIPEAERLRKEIDKLVQPNRRRRSGVRV
jgi:hypothetical protein